MRSVLKLERLGGHRERRLARDARIAMAGRRGIVNRNTDRIGQRPYDISSPVRPDPCRSLVAGAVYPDASGFLGDCGLYSRTQSIASRSNGGAEIRVNDVLDTPSSLFV